MLKYRCPYCGKPAFSMVERLNLLPMVYYWGHKWYEIQCPQCHKYSYRLLGALGRRFNQWPYFLLLDMLPVVTAAIFGVFYLLYHHIMWLFVVECIGIFVMRSVCSYLFVYFDKKRKKERDADGRLTLFVPAERLPRVKKWHIYLVRFPKRGTNAASPVLYGMVCGKSRSAEGRQLELRVIRTDNMDLPAIDEPAWLITDSDKVVEGTVTAVTPKKEL